MYGYIYKTTNLINGKIYIGQKMSSIFLGKNYLGSGSILRRAINKEGKENFKVELIEECNSYDELNKKEVYWIEYYNSRNREIGYNIQIGGRSNNYISRRKISEATKGRKSPMEGKHHSEKTKRKLSKSMTGKEGYWKGKTIPEKSRKRISESTKGRTAWNKGIPATKEQRERLSKTHELLKGRKRMNDGKINKLVKPEEIQYYLDNGWTFGQIRIN